MAWGCPPQGLALGRASQSRSSLACCPAGWSPAHGARENFKTLEAQLNQDFLLWRAHSIHKYQERYLFFFLQEKARKAPGVLELRRELLQASQQEWQQGLPQAWPQAWPQLLQRVLQPELQPVSLLQLLPVWGQGWQPQLQRGLLQELLQELQLGLQLGLQLAWLQAFAQVRMEPVGAQLTQTGLSLRVFQRCWMVKQSLCRCFLGCLTLVWGWAWSTAQCPILSLPLHTGLDSWAMETALL